MEILKRILSDKDKRETLIREFQEKVWNGTGYSADERVNEILSELAYDLDFYEANEEWRKEDPSYYGEEKLEEELKSAITKLKEYKKSSQ